MVAQTDVWGKWRGDRQSVCPRCWTYLREMKSAPSFERRTQIAKNTLQLRTLDCWSFAQECLLQLHLPDKKMIFLQRKLHKLSKKLKGLWEAREKIGTRDMDKKKACEKKKATKIFLAASYFIECHRRRLSLEPDLNDYYEVVKEIMYVLRMW